MQPLQGRTGHIIWQNGSKNVTIVDIPRSIEDAQHDGDSTSPLRLLSRSPLSTPYNLPEPTKEAARARLMKQHPEQAEHAAYRILYESAIQEIDRDTAWALERTVRSGNDSGQEGIRSGKKAGSKRRREERDHGWLEAFEAIRVQEVSLARFGDQMVQGSEELDLDDWPVVHNPLPQAVSLKVNHSRARAYILPPYSSMLCQTISKDTQSTVLRQAFRDQHDGNARLDLVLLDPPWHNASAKRSRHYSTITPTSTVDLLAVTDLGMLMSNQGLVCVWITNKPGARRAVLGEGGIFQQWGVQHIEEWIWYKVTTKGELIFPMDTIMRKPYEVLLLGRKHGTYPIPSDVVPPKRRALFAVPDVHSRKPCLRALLEALLPEKYRALEVFARHLTAGWWSWGNECILFNEESNWASFSSCTEFINVS